MSAEQFLEKLIGGADVEWIPLSSFAQINDGTHQTPKYTTSGVPFVSVQNISDLRGTEKRISEADFEKYKRKPRKGDLFMTRIGDIGTCAIVESNDPLAYYVTLALIRPDPKIVLSKYLKHFIESGLGKSELYKRTIVYAVPIKINLGEIGKILVPIPCPEDPEKSLAIQAEIVRLLDPFSELKAELKAELTAELALRKKQYNHYRDQLLSHPSGNMAWKPLGWVGEVRMCKRVMKNQTSEVGDIPFFKIGTFGREPNAFISRDLFEEFREKYSYPKVGDVLISASGTIGRAVVFDGEEAYFQDSNIVWLENDEKRVLNKYLFHFYQIAKWHVSDGGVIKRLYNNNIRKTLIAVPYPNDPEKSLEEQARIAALLDKFDALTTSITEALPREIELREKQYAHYRDQLLSFPVMSAEAA